MEILKAKNETDAVETAAECVNEFLRDNSKTSVLALFSGGSALKILDYIDESLLNEQLTVTVLDERYTQNMEENNFAQIEKTAFFTFAVDAEVNFIGTLPRPNEDLETMATRFEQSLKTWLIENPKGKILALLGMGEDGHTAGIFSNPNQTEFNNKFHNQNLVIGYDNLGQKPPKDRITTTYTFFEKIDLGIVFACGENKKPALLKVVKKQEQEHTLPALGWQNIRTIKLVTDLELR